MERYYWNDWYSGWGWFLWFGVIILMFSSAGNWGYTYQAHRRFEGGSSRNAMDYLNERYARGEINREEFNRMRIEIGAPGRGENKNAGRSNQTSPAS